ncbi:MAG: TMEM165/GDT1 family protein [Magnetococcales bacterium]|nr:TMEM165/GDT1 family protein [Magnetococcales bacterium]
MTTETLAATLPMAQISAILTAYFPVALAEMGDKSQLVCMTLASRYRPWPIFLGAGSAFILLNILAVLFGATVAAWVPERLLTIGVALLFAGFGLHTLFAAEPDAKEAAVEGPHHHGAITAFLMVFLSEFGDKTQIVVAGLAGTAASPAAIWLGATAALLTTTALGIWAGRALHGRLPLAHLKRGAGILFLLLAAMAALKAAA